MTPQNKPVRVRMSPSPTGALHIGTARGTLFNWLFAKHYGGTFILRLEDTDRARSTLESEIDIVTCLKWLGLDWDEGPTYEEVKSQKLEVKNEEGISEDGKVFEADGKQWRIGHKGEYGPYRQTERKSIYDKYLNQLLESGQAYYCYCTKEELDAERAAKEAQGFSYHYPGRCRNLTEPPAGKTKQLVRLKIPAGPVEFQDLIRGKVTVVSEELDDFALARSNGDHLYNFVVTVDDIEMKITHVIRGEDHVPNTPKQVLIYRALGVELPLFAHLPLVLDTDHSKLSKRSGKTNFHDYIRKGYLPDAMFNFLGLLGWHPRGDEEVFSRERLVEMFDLDRVQKSGAVFNLEKLDWLNREYIKVLSDEDLAKQVRPYLENDGIKITDEDLFVRVVKASRDRLRTLGEIAEQSRFFFTLGDYEPALLNWKETPEESTQQTLRDILSALESRTTEGSFSSETVTLALAELVEKEGRGNIFWPLRAALSGLKASPDPLAIAAVLGRAETLRRVSLAIEKISN